tara:strand:- start:513 stop:2417 length:1905 start_codon:yes stop_codon:yes gene_type:complete
MCGITGVYRFDKKKIDKEILLSMNNSLIHRGPDFGNIFLENNVGLGHRRLSILDVSEKGNQPMKSSNDKYIIVYNGEVYNFLDIKNKLLDLNYKFRSKSDTEVILNSFQEYGNKCFSMFNGMFSIAIYDIINNKLTLARDSFGIKPLYYLQSKKFFCFGSEIKAIKKHPNINLSISKQALSEYLWYGNPMGNNTIYNEINEIRPGSYLEITENNIEENIFFSVNEIKEINIDESDAVKKTKDLLEKSIKRHLISDVDVGVFLSGGIDSSAITAFASKHYKGTLKTFSVGFDFDKGINELPAARSIANKFKTDHHEITVSGNDIIDVIENLVDSHDGPFGDAADIPLYLLTRKLKGKIKVVLQGDGGDEFFGGYSRYYTLNSSKKWSIFSFFSVLIKKFDIQNTHLKRLQRFLKAISEKIPYKRNALLLTMESEFSKPTDILNNKWKKNIKGINPFLEYKRVYNMYPKNINPLQALFYTDSQIILKDTFLEKVDKSTMANSIEVRVPFLDKDLTDFVLSLPPNLKVKRSMPKYLLKKSLNNILPNKILYGKKKGFGVPYAFWLQTGLKNYFLNQVQTDLVKEYFDVSKILKKFHQHQKDNGNHGFLLWKVLIFSVWINKNKLKINDEEGFVFKSS